MSFELVDAALKSSWMAMEKLTLVALCSFANKKTGKARPSQAALAERCGLSIRTVQRSIAKLVEAGCVGCDGRPNHVSSYTILSTDGPVKHDCQSPLKHDPQSPLKDDGQSLLADKHDCQSLSNPPASRPEPVTEPKKEELHSDPASAHEAESAIAAELVALVGMRANGRQSGEVARQQVRGWKAMGADDDMLRAVIAEHVSRNGGETGSLKRFDVPVKAAISARGGVLEGVDRIAAFRAENQRAVANLYRAGKLDWDEARWELYGPPPGQPGCRLDPQILAEAA